MAATGTAQRDSVTGGMYRDKVVGGGARRNAWTDNPCCCSGGSGSGSGSGGNPTCGCDQSGHHFGNLTCTFSGGITAPIGAATQNSYSGTPASILAYDVIDPSWAGTVCLKADSSCVWQGQLNVFNVKLWDLVPNPGGTSPCPTGGWPHGAICWGSVGNSFVDSIYQNLYITVGSAWDAGAGAMLMTIRGACGRYDCHGTFDQWGATSTPFVFAQVHLLCGGTATVNCTSTIQFYPYACNSPAPYQINVNVTLSDAGCT